MRANLKMTGMVLAALFALSAVGVSAAQAASSLDVGANPAWLTADQLSETNVLTLTLKASTGGPALSTVKCKVGHLEATNDRDYRHRGDVHAELRKMHPRRPRR